jgi:hypothetical protein
MFIDSIRSIRPHIVIIDGLRSEVQHVIDAIFFHSHQVFYVFTSSQQLLLPVLRHQKILNVNHWRHEDYLKAVKTDCLLMDPVIRQNLCITDQDDEITIRKKIDEKYYIAGYNCRFMFDYSVEEVKSIIDTHIGTLIICDFANRVNPTPTTSVAMNALISLSDCEGKKKGSPVSAYPLERLAKSNHGSIRLLYFLAKPANNPPLFGLIFDMEVRFYLTGGTFFQRVVSSDAAMEATIKDDVALRTLEFDDIDHIITLLVENRENLNGCWLFPTSFYNPFFNLARIVKVETIEGYVVITIESYQVNVSTTHSCNGLVFQKINDLLLNHKIRILKVEHHAVLPSLDILNKFQWKTAECFTLSETELRPVIGKPDSIPKSSLEVPAKPESRKRMRREEFLHEHWNSNVLQRVYQEEEEEQKRQADEFLQKSADNAVVRNRWTTISNGCHLYVKDSIYADIIERK